MNSYKLSNNNKFKLPYNGNLLPYRSCSTKLSSRR